MMIQSQTTAMVLLALASFVLAVLVTGAAIYFGASMLVDVQDYGLALGTSVAAVGGYWLTALAFGAVASVLSAIPLIGGVFALPVLFLAFPVALAIGLTVVNVAYPGGYLEAAGISVVAVLVLAVASLIGLPTLV